MKLKELISLQKGKKLLPVLKWVWIGIVVVGAVYYFNDKYSEVSAYLKNISVSHLVISFILLILAKIIQADFTRMSLKKTDHTVSFRDSLNISLTTQMGKYLPGGIWQFASKFGVYRLRGLDSKRSAEVMILENLWLLVSSVAFGLTVMLWKSQDLVCSLMGSFCSLFWLKVARLVIPIIWIVSLIIAERILFKNKPVILKDFILVTLEQIAIWVLNGISLWILFPSLGADLLFLFIGAFSISWAAGFVVFFASGGIGVREFVLTIFLSSLIPSDQIVTWATLHRVLWIVTDMLLGLLSGIFLQINPADQNQQVK